MTAHNAEAIFVEFERMRGGNGGQTPEKLLASYCRDVLTSVERMHFDYKTKRDARTPKLEDDDKRNLAKAISGFANSGGGVLIWGIKDEVPPQLKPIADIQAFLKNVLELGAHTTDPAVQGLDGHWIPTDSDPTAGFAAVLVPESLLPPHRAILKHADVQHHYYIRSGSDFVVASHSQLEDMFGRRPRAKLAIARKDFPYELQRWRVVFDVVNEGRSAAKLVYIEIPQQDGVKADESIRNWRWIGHTRNASDGSAKFAFELVSVSALHPGMAVRFDRLTFTAPDFKPGDPVQLPCTLYCEGCAPMQTVIKGTLQPIRNS